MYWRLISHLLQLLNALTCNPITVFFKCIKLHHVYWRLISQLIYKVYCREQGQHLMQQKWDSFGITFYKNILLRIFFKIQCQKSPLAPRHIFNKVDRGIVRSSRPGVFSEKGVLKIRSKFAKATLLKSHFGIGVLL